MEERLKKLEAKVAELEAWKKARIAQQLTYPLDKASQDVIHKDVFVFNGIIADVPPNLPGFMCYLNGRLWAVQVQDPSVYE